MNYFIGIENDKIKSVEKDKKRQALMRCWNSDLWWSALGSTRRNEMVSENVSIGCSHFDSERLTKPRNLETKWKKKFHYLFCLHFPHLCSCVKLYKVCGIVVRLGQYPLADSWTSPESCGWNGIPRVESHNTRSQEPHRACHALLLSTPPGRPQ